MVVLQASTFLTWLLIARNLGPAEQGKFQLLISTVTFIIGFAKLALMRVWLSHPPVPCQQSAKDIFNHCLRDRVSFVVSIVVGLLFYFSADLLEQVIFKLPDFATVFEGRIAINAGYDAAARAHGNITGLGRSDLRAYTYYYLVGLSFLALVVFLSVNGLTTAETYTARLVSLAIGACLACVLILRLVPANRSRLKLNEIRHVHTYAGWLIFVSLFLYLVEQPLVDLIIVGRIASAEMVGIYSVSAKLGSLVAIIPNAMTIVMAPAMSTSLARGDHNALQKQYHSSSEWTARLSVFTAIVLYLLRREGLALFGNAYQNGEQLVIVFLVGQVIVG